MERPDLPVAGGAGGLTRPRARQILRETALFLPRLAILLRRLMSDPRVPRRSKWLAGAVLLYVASPIDIVPDFIPGVGQLDDVIVVLLAFHGLLNRVEEEVILEHWQGDPDIILMLRAGIDAAVRVLPGKWARRW